MSQYDENPYFYLKRLIHFFSQKKLLSLFLKCLVCDYSIAIFLMFRIDKSSDGYASYNELVNFGKMLVKLSFFLFLFWSEMKYFCLFLFLGGNPRYWWSRCGSTESCLNYVCCLWSWQKRKNKQGTIYTRVFGNIWLFSCINYFLLEWKQTKLLHGIQRWQQLMILC